MARVHDKGQVCHFLPDSLYAVVFSTWVLLCVLVWSWAKHRWCSCQSASPKRESRDGRCVCGCRCFFIQKTQPMVYQDLLLYLLSQFQHTHTNSAEVQTVVLHTQHFYSHTHNGMRYHTGLKKKKWRKDSTPCLTVMS